MYAPPSNQARGIIKNPATIASTINQVQGITQILRTNTTSSLPANKGDTSKGNALEEGDNSVMIISPSHTSVFFKQQKEKLDQQAETGDEENDQNGEIDTTYFYVSEEDDKGDYDLEDAEDTHQNKHRSSVADMLQDESLSD